MSEHPTSLKHKWSSDYSVYFSDLSILRIRKYQQFRYWKKYQNQIIYNETLLIVTLRNPVEGSCILNLQADMLKILVKVTLCNHIKVLGRVITLYNYSQPSVIRNFWDLGNLFRIFEDSEQNSACMFCAYLTRENGAWHNYHNWSPNESKLAYYVFLKVTVQYKGWLYITHMTGFPDSYQTWCCLTLWNCKALWSSLHCYDITAYFMWWTGRPSGVNLSM